MIPHPHRNQNGFTLIEVVTVLILVAFLFVAILVYYRHSDTELISQAEVLKTHIRYAQARSMNSATPWGIRYDGSGNEYWLYRDPDIDQKIALPGQSTDGVGLGSMGLTITGASDFTISFDSWGRPVLTGRIFTGGLLTLNLNRNGINGDPINVTENTGFIP